MEAEQKGEQERQKHIHKRNMLAKKFSQPNKAVVVIEEEVEDNGLIEELVIEALSKRLEKDPQAEIPHGYIKSFVKSPFSLISEKFSKEHGEEKGNTFVMCLDIIGDVLQEKIGINFEGSILGKFVVTKMIREKKIESEELRSVMKSRAGIPVSHKVNGTLAIASKLKSKKKMMRKEGADHNYLSYQKKLAQRSISKIVDDMVENSINIALKKQRKRKDLSKAHLSNHVRISPRMEDRIKIINNRKKEEAFLKEEAERQKLKNIEEELRRRKVRAEYLKKKLEHQRQEKEERDKRKLEEARLKKIEEEKFMKEKEEKERKRRQAQKERVRQYKESKAKSIHSMLQDDQKKEKLGENDKPLGLKREVERKKEMEKKSSEAEINSTKGLNGAALNAEKSHTDGSSGSATVKAKKEQIEESTPAATHAVEGQKAESKVDEKDPGKELVEEKAVKNNLEPDIKRKEEPHIDADAQKVEEPHIDAGAQEVEEHHIDADALEGQVKSQKEIPPTDSPAKENEQAVENDIKTEESAADQ